MSEFLMDKWINDGEDLVDAAYCHFEEFGKWRAFEVAEECRRIIGDVEPYSPIDALFHGAAVGGAHGVLAAIASVLGVTERALTNALDDLIEDEVLSVPISADRFMKLIAENQEWIDKTKEKLERGKSA